MRQSDVLSVFVYPGRGTSIIVRIYSLKMKFSVKIYWFMKFLSFVSETVDNYLDHVGII